MGFSDMDIRKALTLELKGSRHERQILEDIKQLLCVFRGAACSWHSNAVIRSNFEAYFWF